MKRYVILAAVLVALLFVVWPRRHGNTGTSQVPAPASETVVQPNSNAVNGLRSGRNQSATGSNLVLGGSQEVNDSERMPEIMQKYNETHLAPVAFFGKVVDQDGGPLAGATVDILLVKSHMSNAPTYDIVQESSNFQKESGADGRFEIAGVSGDALTVKGIVKEGYEQEPLWSKNYGP